MTDSTLVAKEPCPSCGSRDNLARYSDGHAYCFSPGCGHYERGSGEPPTNNRRTSRMAGSLLDGGEYVALPERGLTEATARKWGYRRTRDRQGKWCLVQDVYSPDGAQVVAQKVRYPDKRFAVLGDMTEAGLVGQHLWRSGGRRVCITEGELDAAALSQAFDHKWPVVSIRNGAGSAARDVKAQMEWINSFSEVVLAFDQDEPGRKAAAEVAALLPPRKAKIWSIPLKDACEMLAANRQADMVSAVFQAREHRPDGIVTIADVRDDAVRPIQTGLPWCLPTLNTLTYGRRPGELVALGAGTGVGKTEFITQQMLFDMVDLGEKVAAFMLEQEPRETVLRLAGKKAGKALHIPSTSRAADEVAEAVDDLPRDRLFLLNHFGVIDWPSIRESIRYLHHAEGVRLFYLDHLTALAANDPDREREILERVMSELGGLVKEIPIWMLFVSHLTTPEGKPHEEGGRVTIRHFKGSRAIGFWSHFMFGLERNQQAEDVEERATTTFRVLKDRYTGRATGETIFLTYDRDAGRLVEASQASFPDDEETPF